MLSTKKYGALTAVLLIGSAVAGGFGESYVPSQMIVANDATATARNILSSASLYRLGILGWFVEALCDLSLSVIFYRLTRGVQRELAQVALLTRVLGTTLFAAAELFYVAPLVILSGADDLKSFPADQVNTLALLSLRLYGSGGGIANGFYGVGTALVGVLVFRSGSFPRWIGGLLSIGGTGFLLSTVMPLLVPTIRAGMILLPSAGASAIGSLGLAAWLGLASRREDPSRSRDR